MTLKELCELTSDQRRERELRRKAEAKLKADRVAKAKPQDLPGVRSSGMVLGMTAEEQRAWFDKMRRAVEDTPEWKP